MKIDKLNLDGKKDSIEVLDKIFSAKINKRLVDNVLFKTNANYKGRHAKTKQQNEITGSTSKIYAQKGTGGARHASRKAPIFVGGGVAHGPKGELAYKKRKLNKSEKKLSIASLITEKNKLNNLIIFSDFGNEIKKTKEISPEEEKNKVPFTSLDTIFFVVGTIAAAVILANNVAEVVFKTSLFSNLINTVGLYLAVGGYLLLIFA